MTAAHILEAYRERFNLQEINNTHIAILSAATVLILTYAFFTYEGIIPGFELHGSSRYSFTYVKAKYNFLMYGRKILTEGLEKFHGKPFQIVGLGGPELIFSSKDAKMIGADRRMTMDGFIKREFFPHLPGFEGSGASIGKTVVQDAIRIKLTQSLGLVTEDLCEETASALSDIFQSPSEWTTVSLRHHVPDLVARLSTRVFLGPVVCQDKEWLKIAVDYTINLMLSSRALRQVPAILRPLFHRVLPMNRALMKQSKAARRIIDAEIKRRREIWEKNAREGKPNPKLADSLGWMQDIAAERNDEKFDLAGGQLGLTFAAIHTTSDLLTKCLYRVSAMQEVQQELREEMVAVLRENGWKKTSLYKMKLLDSFLKEVQRLEPPSITSMHRTADKEVTLEDGTVIPKNAPIKIMVNSHMDPEIYPEPEKFDAHRYLNMRNQPGQENNWQFVSVSPESLGFGIGKHACPGRFFASNEVKIALCWMLINYEWKMDGMPKTIQIGTENIADPKTTVDYRSRIPELDLTVL